MIEPESFFIGVSEQMPRTHGNVRRFQHAFQQWPEVHSVDVNLSDGITDFVIDHFMRVFVLQSLVRSERVCIDR